MTQIFFTTERAEKHREFLSKNLRVSAVSHRRARGMNGVALWLIYPQ